MPVNKQPMIARMPSASSANRLGSLAGLIACIFACACSDDVQRIATSARSAPQAAPAPRAAAIPADVEGIRRIDAAGLRQLIQAHGRGTVVNVWASWCGSCREEVPMLLKLREAFQPEGVDFVFVSADEPDAWASAVKLMQDWGGPSPTFAVTGSMGSFKQAMSASWRGALPATFLFDATFKLRHFWEGPIYEHEIAPIVQGFLAGDAIDGETRPPLRGGAGP
jgi:thiol-disulfide isomerase/thioredoxin